MKVGGKVRMGITLALGVLAGLLLVVLPGLVAPPAINSTSTNSNTRTPPTTNTVSPSSSGSESNLPTGSAPAGDIVRGLATLIGLVLVPAIALSVIVRHWTLKRARDRLAWGYQQHNLNP